MACQSSWVIQCKRHSCNKQQCYYLIYSSGGNKEVHSFCKDINPKVNVIERLEWEIAFYDVPILHFTYYATETSSCNIRHIKLDIIRYKVLFGLKVYEVVMGYSMLEFDLLVNVWSWL